MRACVRVCVWGSVRMFAPGRLAKPGISISSLVTFNLWLPRGSFPKILQRLSDLVLLFSLRALSEWRANWHQELLIT